MNVITKTYKWKELSEDGLLKDTPTSEYKYCSLESELACEHDTEDGAHSAFIAYVDAHEFHRYHDLVLVTLYNVNWENK